MVPFILALALAAAPAVDLGDVGPLTTSPLARPATPPPVAAPPAPKAPTAEPAMTAAARLTPNETPNNLDPADDYSLVAWCHGALSGHMELYGKVKDELNSVSPGSDAGDEKQMDAGREYLALYSRALKAAEAASPKNIHDLGVANDIQGKRIWAAASAAEPRTRMWSWLMWELPPRCEIAARRLEEKSKLFGQALKGADKSKDLAVAEPKKPEGLRGLRGLQ